MQVISHGQRPSKVGLYEHGTNNKKTIYKDQSIISVLGNARTIPVCNNILVRMLSITPL